MRSYLAPISGVAAPTRPRLPSPFPLLPLPPYPPTPTPTRDVVPSLLRPAANPPRIPPAPEPHEPWSLLNPFNLHRLRVDDREASRRFLAGEIVDIPATDADGYRPMEAQLLLRAVVDECARISSPDVEVLRTDPYRSPWSGSETGT